ncbi:hypothetical protein [Stenotrophomonas sp.]|uniref:hypothetical protein n=1 Tax=Stenotrophomonas sp. TaxID=69392 RepID=UPI0028ACAD6E|nr:hypothetical protein [Stenotrophomonas sp.]
MNKSVDLFFDSARVTSGLSAAALCALVCSFVLIAIIGGSTTTMELEFAVASLMGVFLIASISGMIGATVGVVRNRRQLAADRSRVGVLGDA